MRVPRGIDDMPDIDVPERRGVFDDLHAVGSFPEIHIRVLADGDRSDMHHVGSSHRLDFHHEGILPFSLHGTQFRHRYVRRGVASEDDRAVAAITDHFPVVPAREEAVRGGRQRDRRRETILEEEGRAAADARVVAALDRDLLAALENADSVARHAIHGVLHTGGGGDDGVLVEGDRCDRVFHSCQFLDLFGRVEIPHLG